MISLKYLAVLHPEGTDGFSVRFPQFDGCFTQGYDLISAIDNAREALQLHVDGIIADGGFLPHPVGLCILEPGETTVAVCVRTP